MSTDEYVPEEEDFIDSWACAHVTPHDMTAEEAKGAARAFLARVRRDAWDEGYEAGMLDTYRLGRDMDLTITPAPNPYRETGDRA